MNKEKLIAEMREAFKEKYNLVDFKTQNIDLDGISECFAEAALTLMSREWVSVEDELPLPISSTVGKISKYVPFITLDDKEWFGYYDYIGKVWQAQGFKTFRKDEVKSWFNLPTPPKDNQHG